jgi:cytochrome c
MAMPTTPGTKADAKALGERAAAHVAKVGFDQAMKDFSADQATWGLTSRDRVAYVYAYDFNGTVLAHSVNAAAVGKVLLDIKDPDGKTPIAESIKVARSGPNGWIEFKWSNPATKKIGQGVAYIIRVPGKDAYVAGHAFVD